MLTQDTAAFVEQITVAKSDRRADKLRREAASAELQVAHTSLELHLAEDALKRLESANLRETTTRWPWTGFMRRRPADDHAAYERTVGALRDKLRAERTYAKTAEERARAHEANRPQSTWYRLHSAHHHATYSETEFQRLLDRQTTSPVRLRSAGGVSWWWYRDRFWWEDEGLNAGELSSLVQEADEENASQRSWRRRSVALARGEMEPALTRSEQAIPEPVRQAVWRRDQGRCTGCGGDRDVVFHMVAATSHASEVDPSMVELRCAACRRLGNRTQGQAPRLMRSLDRPIS